MSDLTPVEVLQAEIGRIGDLPEKLKALGWDLPVAEGHNLFAIFGKYTAALELAKAVEQQVPCNEARRAFDKLIEALQR